MLKELRRDDQLLLFQTIVLTDADDLGMIDDDGN
jgi:hypothetical protein